MSDASWRLAPDGRWYQPPPTGDEPYRQSPSYGPLFRRGRAKSNTWWSVLQVTAGALCAIGVSVFFLHPSAAFVGYTNASSSLQQGTISAQCIWPFSRWTAHYYNAAPPQTQMEQANLNAGDAACNAVIDGREHVGWTLIVLSVLVLGATLIAERRHAKTNG